jgi:hypothetical protein
MLATAALSGLDSFVGHRFRNRWVVEINQIDRKPSNFISTFAVAHNCEQGLEGLFAGGLDGRFGPPAADRTARSGR